MESVAENNQGRQFSVLCLFPETDEFETVQVTAHSVSEAGSLATNMLSESHTEAPIIDSVIFAS